ncbi:MAG TPA: cellulase family glycosylhydrolase [Bacteroidales bacterium]|jgi:aryl-phospho-beta-D-glucosidase BglC (GH1 family)|nr:cellulase family glycosylhydrolase [Bacteroidales bacterium]
MKLKFFLTVVSVFYTVQIFSQNYAFTMNAKLGMGINLGNAYEATGLGEWGVNPDSTYFVDIAQKGFASIRIPARWSAHALTQAPYTIHQYFMDTIEWAVKQSLKNGLYVVLDMHHYEEMFQEPAAHKERYLAMWEQIAEHFKDYSDSLYLEIFNEPHDNFTPELWNQYLLDGLEVIREKNPTRMVIIGTAEYGNLSGLSKLQIPSTDTCLIVTVHYYNPFDFTHQGATFAGVTATNVKWDSTAAQIQAVKNDMEIIKNYSISKNVPIYIGEFGVIQNADDISRARWAGHLRKVFENYGFSAAYWEYCSGFGLYDYALDCYYNGLLKALTDSVGECDCAMYDTIIVKNSTFKRGLNPWVVYKNEASGAQAQVEIINEEARLEIIKNSTVEWHIQFVYPSFPITMGSTYTMVFDVYSSSNTPLTAQISLDGGTYAVIHDTLVNVTDTKQTFSTTFTHNEPSIKKARMVFECGTITSQYLYFDNIHIYEVVKGVPVQTITIQLPESQTSAQITTKQGSLQLSADVVPANATNTDVVWSIISGGQLATIDNTGLLTATGYGNGSVRVQALAYDGSGVKATKTIYISGQTSSIDVNRTNCSVKIDENEYIISGNTIQNIEIYSIIGQLRTKIQGVNNSEFYIPKSYLAQNMNVIKIVTDTGVHTVKFFKK